MVDQLVSLVESGCSLRQAGRAMGVSATTVYRRLAVQGDAVRRRRRRSMSPTDRRRILALAQDGEVSIRRIAASVRRSWHTVRRVVAGANLPRLVPAHRCPVCGYRVTVTPCQVCSARSRQTTAEQSSP